MIKYFFLLIIILIFLISFYCYERFTLQKKIKVYNFNTEWCGYSKMFQPIWNKFSKSVNNNNVSIIDVKCDNKKNYNLCNKYPIRGFPTILFTSNNFTKEYDGNRTQEDLLKFLDNFIKSS